MNTPLLKGNPGFFEKWLIVGPGQGHTPLSLEHLAVSGSKMMLKKGWGRWEDVKGAE